MPYYAYSIPNKGYIYFYPAATVVQANQFMNRYGGTYDGFNYGTATEAKRAYPGQAYILKAGQAPPGTGSSIGKPPPKRKRPKSPGPNGAQIVAIARGWLGVPYLYGGTTRQGVDCSGLVQQVAFAAGVKDCPRTSEAQWLWCQHIHESEVGAGDLVFFTGAEIDPPPGHVGIVVARGTMINAPYTGTVVRIDHYADGPGVNHIIGYGRMRGVGYSRSANIYTQGPPSKGGYSGQQQIAAANAVGGTVMMTGAILFIALAFIVLIGAALLFRR